MKIVQWTLAVVGIIALAIVGVGFLLPSAFLVQRSIDIKAPPKKVYDLIVEPKQWMAWSVWTQRDPAMKIDFTGKLKADGTLAGTLTGPMGDMPWTASRVK